MRTIKELVCEAEIDVKYARSLHAVCSNKLDALRPTIIKELLPSDYSLYVRFGDNITIAEPVEVQIKQLVVHAANGKTARYNLAENMRPKSVTILVAKDGYEFYIRYLNKNDIMSLPPFHVMDKKNGWYSVCLGRELDPTRERLANLLEVANLTDTYMNLLSLPGILGVAKAPEPFDAWTTAEPLLKLGKSIEGFELVKEITL